MEGKELSEAKKPLGGKGLLERKKAAVEDGVGREEDEARPCEAEEEEAKRRRWRRLGSGGRRRMRRGHGKRKKAAAEGGVGREEEDDEADSVKSGGR
ncbi:hypothetical protein E2562_003601 [Oryza meyeriana var. granulata]|uniref:Uncharacterized protein n=1 Tax=Oryza meyeriana var. granulata TaxID=110450 RepID=A0A6G1CNB5_9ORYZ|nr:hypothetical protein E2562_003601 [Oryza meyeriana var. granulata]